MSRRFCFFWGRVNANEWAELSLPADAPESRRPGEPTSASEREEWKNTAAGKKRSARSGVLTQADEGENEGRVGDQPGPSSAGQAVEVVGVAGRGESEGTDNEEAEEEDQLQSGSSTDLDAQIRELMDKKQAKKEKEKAKGKEKAAGSSGAGVQGKKGEDKGKDTDKGKGAVRAGLSTRSQARR